MLELHGLLNRMHKDRVKFKQTFTEGEDLIKVRDSLNQRAITIRELLLEDPENKNLNFELNFCLSEAERLEEELEQFQNEYGSIEKKINIQEQLIDYDINELKTYIGFLEQLEVDKQLVESIRNTVKSLDENLLGGLQVCSITSKKNNP